MSAVTIILFGIAFLALAEKWCQAPFSASARRSREKWCLAPFSSRRVGEKWCLAPFSGRRGG